MQTLAQRCSAFKQILALDSNKRTYGGRVFRQHVARNAGLTLMEMVIGVAILSAIAIFVVIQYAGSRESINLNQAVSEIEKLRGAAVAFRSTYAQNGVYTGLSQGTGANDGLDLLSDGGFGVAPFDTGDGENTFGLDAQVYSWAGGDNARISYDVPTFAACAQLATRYSDAEVTGDTSISIPTSFSDGVTYLVCRRAAGRDWQFILEID